MLHFGGNLIPGLSVGKVLNWISGGWPKNNDEFVAATAIALVLGTACWPTIRLVATCQKDEIINPFAPQWTLNRM